VTEQVFEKVIDCGQVRGVYGLLGSSFLGYGHVSGAHCVYCVYNGFYLNCLTPDCLFTPVF
jgi:hypothetical protein